MYIAPKPEVIGEFTPPDLEDLKSQHGIGELPRSAWRGEDWSANFDQDHPTRTKFRLEEGDRAPVSGKLVEVISRWHLDITLGAAGMPAPLAVMVGAYPSTTKVIDGVIPGLPGTHGSELWELTRIGDETYRGLNHVVHELTEKALDAGDARVVELDSGIVYLLPKGLIHTRTDDESLRIVGQSHPDIPYDPLWLAMNDPEGKLVLV